MANDLVVLRRRLETSVVFPNLDDRELVGASLREDGEQGLVAGQLARYLALNPVFRTQARILRLEQSLRHKHGQETALLRKLACTDAFRQVVIAGKEARLPWLHHLLAFLFALLACAALFVGNRVAAAYVTAGSDQYAIDPFGAALFCFPVVLFAGALKAYHRLLVSDAAKRVFSHLIFGIGALSFITWAGCMALSFAPDTSGGTAWLIGADEAIPFVPQVMVLSHLFVDVACSFGIFVGALATTGRKRIAIANPLYGEITRGLAALGQEIDDLTDELGGCEAHLARVEDGRTVVEQSTRLALQQKLSTIRFARSAAADAATLELLDPPPSQPSS